MEIGRNVIGVDIEIEFDDGTRTKGHISPVGTHIDRKQKDHERIRWHLEAMREAIEGALKPYGSRKG